MIIDHDTSTDQYKVLCEDCDHAWLFEGYELYLKPWPHFVCPHCGGWIAAF